MRDIVSIFMPVRNGASYIADSLLSLEQIRKPFHLYIKNSLSTDATLQKINDSKLTNISCITSQDSSQAEGLNQLLELSNANRFMILNSDEMLLPWALEKLKQGKSGVDNNRAYVIYGDTLIVDSENRFLRLLPGIPFRSSLLRKRGNFIATVSTLFELQSSNHRLNINLRILWDWDLFLKLCSDGTKFCYVKAPIGVFRIHNNQISKDNVSRFSKEHEFVRRSNLIIPPHRTVFHIWTLLFAALKLFSGGYFRQMRMNKLKGMEVFKDGEWDSKLLYKLGKIYSRSMLSSQKSGL